MEYVYPNIVLAKELRCRSDPPLTDQSLRDHTTPESSECIKEEINTQTDQIARLKNILIANTQNYLNVHCDFNITDLYSSELSEEVQDPCNSTRTDKVPLSMEDIYSPCILLVNNYTFSLVVPLLFPSVVYLTDTICFISG